MVWPGEVPALPRPPGDLRQLRFTLLTIAVAGFIFADLYVGGRRAAEYTVALIVAAGVILGAMRRPAVALYALVIFVPLQVPALAALYKYVAPAGVVREMGYIKDALVGGICLAALEYSTRHRRRPRRFDAIDWFALIYVGIATAYLLIPFVVRGALGGEPANVRISAWRLDCVFVVLLFAARRLPFTPAQLRRARILVMGLAVFLLSFSILEVVSETTYQHLLARHLGYPGYQVDVLQSSPPRGGNYVIKTTVGGLTVVRAGSLFPDGSIALGFYTLIPLALGVQLLSQTRSRVAVLATGAIALMLILSETRSAMLGGVVIILMSVWLAYRLHRSGRLRLVTVTIVATLVIAPFALNTTFVQRFESIFHGTSNTSNQLHVDRSSEGLQLVLDRPAGLGLGSNPSTGRRFGTQNLTVSENSYLQVGNELGVAGMLAFIGLLLALFRKLLQVARERSAASQLGAAMWLALGGLLIGGFFLQIWVSLPVSLTFWGLAGAALGAHRHRTYDISPPRPTSRRSVRPPLPGAGVGARTSSTVRV